MAPMFSRRARRFALALFGLGLPAAPWLWAAPDVRPGIDGSACNPAVHALTLQGRGRSLQELFGRLQW